MVNSSNSPTDDDEDLLSFAEEDAQLAEELEKPWKILIVDDESEVHHVTDLALADMQVVNRPLELLHAESGEQARSMMRDHPDVAIILMDVVMETEHAGLDAVEYIRETLGNRFVRIILRTGQPGQAPERDVITRFDINDYKEKTELTADKLFTCIYTSVCAHRDLLALDSARAGMETILEAASSLFELQPRNNFYQGALQQLSGFLHIAGSTALVRLNDDQEEPTILAATGWLSGATGRSAARVLGDGAMEKISRAFGTAASHAGNDHYTGYFEINDSSVCVLYMPLEEPLSTARKGLADGFCQHLAVVVRNFEQLQ